MVDGNGGIAGFSGDCRLCWFDGERGRKMGEKIEK